MQPQQKDTQQQLTIAQRKEIFTEAVQPIWGLNNQNTTSSVWVSIRKKLNQFQLAQSYSEAHILAEAYCRGIAAIEKGKTIQNPVAWMRLTSYNYICELSRAQKKSVELDEECHASSYSNLIEEDEDPGDIHRRRIKLAREAFQCLSPSYQEIIQLNVIDGFSYNEIQNYFQRSGKGHVKIETLRKRKQRAVECMRYTYERLSAASESNPQR
jgi:DNA-directed RNA polymerase specialized sigma24 family protein